MKDCNKLFNVLSYEKNDSKRVDESLKILYKIVMLMSNNYDTKCRKKYYLININYEFLLLMLYLFFLVRTATIKYLCQHSVLPTIIVTIIKVSVKIKQIFLYFAYPNAYYECIL